MSDKTIIRLSADAVDRLFPEGTDARVQLQQAVLSEVAGRFVKTSLDERLRAELTTLIKQTVAGADLDELVAEHFLRKGYAGDLVPRPGGRVAQAIGEAVRQKVTDEFHEYVAKCVDANLADAVQRANEFAEHVVRRHINDGTAGFLKEQVNAAWSKTLKHLSESGQ